jgi:hypothetical protein
MSQANGQVREPQLACMFCAKTSPTGAALDNGWVPFFWHDGTEYSQKGKGVCPACVAAHLKFNEEFGDYELLPGHSPPETA